MTGSRSDPPVFEEGIAASCGDENLLADLFHALSQPLTTLQCCLAGSLREPRNGARYRRDLQAVLRQAESVVFFTSAIRELVICPASLGKPQESDLSACVKEVVDDLLPVAESCGLELTFACRGFCHVKLEDRQLRQAVFYVVESALNHSQPGSAITILVRRERREVGLTVRMSPPPAKKLRLPPKPNRTEAFALQRRVTLAIARRTFESAAGTFQIQRGARQTTLMVRLPRSHREPALPLARASQRCG
ncbi:MAG: hypothetical protein WB952_04590 [Terriglobales bacterium]